MRITAVFLASLLLACGDASSPPSATEQGGSSAAGQAGASGGPASGAGGAPAGGAGASPPPVDWQPCNLHSEGDGPEAQCATVALPLRHDQPDGDTVPRVERAVALARRYYAPVIG